MNNCSAHSADLVGAARVVDFREVEGHVFAPGDLSRRFVVELLADGLPIALQRADGYAVELGASGVGDGCYGFVFPLSEAILIEGATLEVRLANGFEIVDRPLKLRPGTPPEGRRQPSSHVGWLGGLRLQGWIQGAADPRACRVKALIDGAVVAEAPLSGWTHLRRGDGFDVAPAFDLHLPQRFADGRVRAVAVMSSEGQMLGGSPCSIVAFADGLEAFIDGVAELESERLRARSFDRLLPQSLPFSALSDWTGRFPLRGPPAERPGVVGVVLIGESGIDASLDSLAAAQGCNWVAAALPHGGDAVSFRPADLAQFMQDDAAEAGCFVFAPAGTRFEPPALALLQAALDGFPAAPAAYGDLTVGPAAAPWPLAFPAFDYERCLEQGYCASVFALRRAGVAAALRLGAGSLFELFLAELTPAAAAAPVHVPGLLAARPDLPRRDVERALLRAVTRHAAARPGAAEVAVNAAAAVPSVRLRRRPSGVRVSVLIPTRNQPVLLGRCLAALRATTASVPLEVIVIDNDSSDAEALATLEAAAVGGARILRVPGPFNFARLNNVAAAAASGEHLLFLNDDVEALQPGWLEEMQGRLAEPDVGAVGATLLYPSGTFQHAGVVLGPNLSAAHALLGQMAGEAGYGGMAEVARACSAVTAACLLTRRRLFLAEGGFDELVFAIDYNDVDYCLKLRAAGFRVLVTPYAQLRHAEGFSRGARQRPDQKERYDRELWNLRQRWGDVLVDDPYYSPLLSLDTIPFAALAWPPRDCAARQPTRPRPRPVPTTG